jgi:hypothetical protein
MVAAGVARTLTWARPVFLFSTADMNKNLPAWPAWDVIESGIADLSRGVESVPALLVSIGAPRLRRLGFPVPPALPSPEHRLYQRLQGSDPDSAHSRYNALIRRLVSFERAAECVS